MAEQQNSATETLQITRTVFDLDSFEEVTLIKNIDFTDATSIEEALSRLGGDSKKLLAAVNDGLQADAKRTASKDASIPWLQEDEEGKTQVFAGTVADTKMVNNAVLMLAKTSFGYMKAAAAKDKEGKAAAKAKAMQFVKDNEVLKNGLKESAAETATA